MTGKHAAAILLAELHRLRRMHDINIPPNSEDWDLTADDSVQIITINFPDGTTWQFAGPVNLLKKVKP